MYNLWRFNQLASIVEAMCANLNINNSTYPFPIEVFDYIPRNNAKNPANFMQWNSKTWKCWKIWSKLYTSREGFQANYGTEVSKKTTGN